MRGGGVAQVRLFIDMYAFLNATKLLMVNSDGLYGTIFSTDFNIYCSQ